MADSFNVVMYPDEFLIVDNSDDWTIYTTTETEYTLSFETVGMNDAALAIAARDAAIAAQVQADLDALATAADRVATGLDRAATNADAAATAADRVQTGLDRVATGNDVALTHADVVLTHADAVATAADAVATAADRVQTGLDRAQTGADRVQTGLDRVATGADVATANALLAAFTGGLTGQILIKTSNADYAFGWQNPTGMLTAIYDPTNIAADVFARANHTGTQLAATISNFNAAADARIAAAVGVSVQAFSAILSGTTASYTVALDTKLGGIAAGADVTVSALPVAIHAAASKATPVDADELVLSDSAAAFGLKKLTWLNTKATLKTYFDTLYYTPATLAAYAFARPAKTTLTGADTVNITDSAAADVDKKITWTNVLEQIRVFLFGVNKATPVDADIITIGDSAAANAPKYTTLASLITYIFGVARTFTSTLNVNGTFVQGQGGTASGANILSSNRLTLGSGRNADGVTDIIITSDAAAVNYGYIQRLGGTNGTLNFGNTGTGGLVFANIASFSTSVSITGTLNKGITYGATTIAGNSSAATVGMLLTSSSTTPCVISFERSGAFAAHFGIDSDNKLKWGGWSFGANSYEIVHQQNLNTYVAFTKKYVSGQQTLVSAGLVTLAHGLGAKPTGVNVSIVCITAEAGYSVGDEIFVPETMDDTGAAGTRGISIVPDATNLNIRQASNASGAWALVHKTTGAGAGLTPANWRFIVRAWL